MNKYEYISYLEKEYERAKTLRDMGDDNEEAESYDFYDGMVQGIAYALLFARKLDAIHLAEPVSHAQNGKEAIQ